MDCHFSGIPRNSSGSADSSAASAAALEPPWVSQAPQSCSAGCRQEMASVTAMLQDLSLIWFCSPGSSTDLPAHRWSRCWVDRLEALDLGPDDSQVDQPARGGSSSISLLVCQMMVASCTELPHACSFCWSLM